MTIKDSTVFYLMTMFTTFMMGSYVYMYNTAQHIDKPDLDSNFDMT